MNFKANHHLFVYVLRQELGLSVFFWNMYLQVLFPSTDCMFHM